MVTRPKTIFFDLDETLIANTVEFKTLLNYLLQQTHSDSDPAKEQHFLSAVQAQAQALWIDILDHQRQGEDLLTAVFSSALDQAKLDTKVANAMTELFLQQASESTQLQDNALSTLATLRAEGYQTGLITNGLQQLQQRKIQHHQLDLQFDAIIISEQAGAHKPDSHIFSHALRTLQTEPAQAWHVGDHFVNDVEGAKNAGLTAVLFAPDQSSPKLGEASGNAQCDPDFVISSLNSIIELMNA